MLNQEPDSIKSYMQWEDDDMFAYDEPELKWEKDMLVPLRIESFLLMENQYFVHFAKQCLFSDIHLINEIPTVKLKLFRVMSKGRNIFICTSLCIDFRKHNEIAFLLEPILKVSDKIIAFQCCPIVLYKGNFNESAKYVTRAIHSNEVVDKKGAPMLEMPNILTGLSAGVYNLGDCLRKPTSVFIMFMSYDFYGIDQPMGEKITYLLKQKNIPFVKNYVYRIRDQSNLYA